MGEPERRANVLRAVRPIVKVFVVASSPVARAGLRAVLTDEVDVEVVGEGTSSEELSLSGADMVFLADEALIPEAAHALDEDGSQGLLLLSENDGIVASLRGLGLRGWGVLAPDALPEEISAAIHAVARGLVVLPEALAERLLDESFPGAPDAIVDEPSEPLTSREREVLELLGRGLSNRLIAGELHISEHTVKFHVSSVYAKLGVSSRVGAVSQGARRGLISL